MVPLKCNVTLARNFPRVKRLLDRVTSGSSGKLRKHLTRYASVVESRRTMCLLDTRTRKTSSVEDASCIIRGRMRFILVFPDLLRTSTYRLNIISAMLRNLTQYTTLIKTSGSESRGQEEAACMRVLGLCDHYSELFTRIGSSNF